MDGVVDVDVVVDVGEVVKVGGAVGPHIFFRHDGSKEAEDTDSFFFLCLLLRWHFRQGCRYGKISRNRGI